ncbi:MAG: hypothetical protein WC506_03775 [Candidatus Micrarchaeia archaeon]
MFKESVIISQGPGPFSKGGPARDFFSRHSDGKVQAFLFRAKAGLVIAGSLVIGKNPRSPMSWLYKKRADWLSEGAKHHESGISYLKAAFFSSDSSTSLYLSKLAFHEFKCLPEGKLGPSETAFVSHELNYEKEKVSLRSNKSTDSAANLKMKSSGMTLENIQAYSGLVLERLESADKAVLGGEVSVIHLHPAGHYRAYLEFIFRDTCPSFTLGEALGALKHIQSRQRPFSVTNFYAALNKGRQGTGKKQVDVARIGAISADTDPALEEYKILYTIYSALDRFMPAI